MAIENIGKQANIKTTRGALTDKAFLDFLDKAPDKSLFNPSDPEAVKRHQDAYELKKTVTSGFSEIYTKKIKEDLGIEISISDLQGIDDYLSKEAFENPTELKSLAEKIKDFTQLPKRIEIRKNYIYKKFGAETKLEEKEKLLARVSKNVEDTGLLKKAVGLLDHLTLESFGWTELSPIEKKENETKFEKAKRYGKYLSKATIRTIDTIALGIAATGTATKEILRHTPVLKKYVESEEERYNKEKLEEKYKIKPEDSQRELAKIREDLRMIRNLKVDRKSMEMELATINKELFEEGLMPAAIVAGATRKKIDEKLRELMTSGQGPTGSVDKLFEIRSKAKSTSLAKEKGAFDYNKNFNLDTISLDLDNAIEIQVKRQLYKAIGELSIKDEDSPLAKLEEILKPILSADPSAREFVIKEVSEIINKATARNADTPKLILLKILLAKMEAEKIEENLKNSNWLLTTRARIKKAFP